MNSRKLIKILKKSGAALLSLSLTFSTWGAQEAFARVIKVSALKSTIKTSPISVRTMIGNPLGTVGTAASIAAGAGVLPSVGSVQSRTSTPLKSVEAILPAASASRGIVTPSKKAVSAVPLQRRAQTSKELTGMKKKMAALPKVTKGSTGQAYGSGAQIEGILTRKKTGRHGVLVRTEYDPAFTSFRPSSRLRRAQTTRRAEAIAVPMPTPLEKAAAFMTTKQGIALVAFAAAAGLIAMQLYMPAIIASVGLMGLTGILFNDKDGDGAAPKPAVRADPQGHLYNTAPDEALQKEVEEITGVFARLKDEIGRVIVGQEEMVDSIITAMIAGEHILLEGVPGVAKTRTVQAFADATGADFQRIQGTSDKMPADILGAEVLQPQEDGSRKLVHIKGPIFARVVLFDEINRVMPKTQSALMEAMQERQVTIGDETFDLPSPFLLLATQNPIEQEGTFPLPEAQQDRFMYKIVVPQPSREERKKINALNRKKAKIKTQQVVELDELLQATEIAERVHMDPAIEDYIQDIIDAVLEPHKFGIGNKGMIEQAMITRASIYMEKAARIHALMAGRSYVIPQDVRDITPKLLRHRVKLSYAAGDVTTEMLLAEILLTLDTPRPKN